MPKAISLPRVTLKGRNASKIQRLAHFIGIWRERQHLNELDDAALKDIGLTRRQAEREARRAIWDAPEMWRR